LILARNIDAGQTLAQFRGQTRLTDEAQVEPTTAQTMR